MRKLLALGVVLALLVGILAGVDVLVRHTVERDIAAHIEKSVPGATASVHISSWPFLWRLAASGTVPSLHADVLGVKVGPFAVDSVDLAIQDINVSRSDLANRKVVLRSIRSATVTARISQQSIDTGSGLPVTLGDGTVGLGGIQVPARVAVGADRLSISVPPLPAITIPLLPAALVPCRASAVISAGLITVSCTTTKIPSALLAQIPQG